jgi:hypothetical protein
MTPENFCFWLQGLFELEDPKQLTESQTKLVKEHLELVFTTIAPQEKRDSKSLADLLTPSTSGSIGQQDPYKRTYC